MRSKPDIMVTLAAAPQAVGFGDAKQYGAKNHHGRLHHIMMVALLAVLAACGPNRSAEVLHPVTASAQVGTPVQMFAATTRLRSATDPYEFTNDRGMGLSFASYAVSVPPEHKPGKVEWPRNLPADPAESFAVQSVKQLNQGDFSTQVARAARAGGGDVVVFVHGYKNSFQSALFRAVQLKHDTGYEMAMVAFAWPSQNSVAGYMTDKEAATYSRDYLEQALNSLAAQSDVKRIHIVAHSMGGFVTMETLRQASLRERSALLDKLNEVWLMSPDIDIGVFMTQMEVIGRLDPPLTIAISDDDAALGLSQRMAGNVPRAGNMIAQGQQSERLIAQYGIRIINMSDSKGHDAMNHGKFVGLLQAMTGTYAADGESAPVASFTRAGLFAMDAIGIPTRSSGGDQAR